MNKLCIALLYSSLALFMYSCAQQVAPTGGDIDTTAPELVSSSPENYSTGFNSKKIILTFDEYIRLDKIQDNLIVSPVFKHEADMLVKGKSLVITLLDTLAENTTYVINFGAAIIDITEKNAKEGFQYVFSTGSEMDSLEFEGEIIDAFTLAPQKNITAMLYEQTYDSVPYLEKPRYISKTDEHGRFYINHIKAGNYKVFALSDNNKNYLFDQHNEAIGFVDTLVNIQADSTASQQAFISLFIEDHEKQYLKKYQSKYYGQFGLKFNRPVSNLKLHELNGVLDNRKVFVEENKNHDSLVYWISPPENIDTLLMEILLNDTVLDTVNVRMKKKNKKKEVLKVNTNIGQGSRFNLDVPLKITLNHPLKNIERNLLQLFEDSTEVSVVWQAVDSSYRYLEAAYSWKENTNYTLSIASEAFTDIYDINNDSLKQSFTTQELKKYGSLKINISFPESSGVLLLMKDGKTIKERSFNSSFQTFDFNYLTPGKYSLKLIHDINENGKWDPGNYLNHQQAEEVTIHKSLITIRSNWDQEIEWKLEQ